MSVGLISTALSIPGVLRLRPRRFCDARGWFSETFNARDLEAAGVSDVFVQDNLSLSLKVGTVRGLHYQAPPHAQAKLVSVITGCVLDAVVDARVGSPTFGRSLTIELSAETGDQIYVPAGFLHGFVTRQDDTRVLYKVAAPYDPEADGSVFWGDPDLGIDWGIEPGRATVSEKDAAAPRWSAFRSPFVWSPS